MIYGLPESFRYMGAGFFWGIPFPVIVAAALLIALHLLLHRTVLGRAIYAIGAIPTRRGLRHADEPSSHNSLCA